MLGKHKWIYTRIFFFKATSKLSPENADWIIYFEVLAHHLDCIQHNRCARVGVHFLEDRTEHSQLEGDSKDHQVQLLNFFSYQYLHFPFTGSTELDLALGNVLSPIGSLIKFSSLWELRCFSGEFWWLWEPLSRDLNTCNQVQLKNRFHKLPVLSSKPTGLFAIIN